MDDFKFIAKHYGGINNWTDGIYYMDEVSDKKTTLYHTHVDLGGNMVSFGGFLLPIHYSGINHEHMIVRSKAGLFDISHMGEFIISGTDAEIFLQKVTVNDVQSLEVGQAHYSALCYKHGGIVDDLLV